MASVRLTDQAQRELDAIVEYYERIGASGFAAVFESNLIEKLRRLERFPRMGRIVPEIGDDALREVVYRSYRVVYIVDRDDTGVSVLTIFHSSRQFGASSSSER